MSYAADTSVSVEKTRGELESVLRRFGADGFGYITESGRAAITFRFSGKCVRFILPLPDASEKRFTQVVKHGRSVKRRPEVAAKEWEQSCRSAWRALCLCVKAKLVAVEAKITTFEDEFLAHIVLPNNRTVSQEMLPRIEEAYRNGNMPSFALALPDSRP